MSEHWFITLRNWGAFFAAVMLFKYYVFLLVSPFYDVKEARRRRRVAALHLTAPYRPLVSVIVPAWNEEVGILRTVRSLLASTYPNIEIVVVNDGSTDRSHAKMQAYLEELSHANRDHHGKIRYFYKPNGGKGHTLNFGIERSRGQIVVTMDADSVFEPTAIANLVEYFKDPTVDAAVGNVRVATNNTLIGRIQRLEYLFGFYYKRAHSVMGAEYIYGGACAAFRRSSTFDRIGLFDAVNKTEDIEMSLRTRYHGLKSVYAEDVVCYTEGASTVRGLINQRLRWKKGRFDTFGKYRRMFFSLDRRHNPALSWFVLPYCLLAEFQLLFEPIGFTLLLAYSFLSGDYISLALGVLFVAITYIVVSIFSHQKLQLGVLALFPFTWPLFYFLVWVEYVVLLKSLAMILRGGEIEWQSWERRGVEEGA
ncbi:MAG TPA: glycosyltransferase family 2 protein [Candidatus Saccharimonadia bacterium]|nr:glycosyltransferase family 2 protein [Candidatus Saccharimonadia bacterium]